MTWRFLTSGESHGRGLLVVEDRELSVEAEAREALLVAQAAVRGAEYGVGLRRHLAELHPVDHRQPTTSSDSASACWADSIDSKRARKFP